MSSKPTHRGDNRWLGNMGVLSATLQVIDGERWKTVGQCADTPNALAQELSKPQYKGLMIWIRDGLGGRRYHGEVK